MKLLDLGCGAGGASVGYRRAGFDVVGVDLSPQPHYPFTFVQGDMLEVDLSGFDAIHASPPCQRWTAYGRREGVRNEEWPDLIGPVRERLAATGVPYVIENVPGAPLESPITLCGSAFGLDVRRHRLFESNVALLSPGCAHGLQTPRFPPATNRTNLRSTVEIGVWRIPLAVQHRAMGIFWMTLPELSQAIPPAYSRHVGTQLLSPPGGGGVNTAEALEIVAARDAALLEALEAERAQPPVPPVSRRQAVRQILLLVHKASTG